MQTAKQHPHLLSKSLLSLSLCLAPILLAVSCKNPEPPPQGVSPSSTTHSAPTNSEKQQPLSEKTVEPAETTSLGEPAPDFRLKKLDGETISLSQYRGSIVVLEWFNPQCPFVKAAHTQGSLIHTADHLMKKGVKYLAINSGGLGKQGYGEEANRAGQKTFGLSHPILMDKEGTVGHQYGATNTPHIFIINKEGILVYRGAVDNSPDGEGQEPNGGQLINYLTQAVDELLEGKPISVSETKAYGCSVKYSK